jgi:hypothetical protein
VLDPCAYGLIMVHNRFRVSSSSAELAFVASGLVVVYGLPLSSKNQFELTAAATEPRGLQGTAIEAATLSSMEAVNASLNLPTIAKQHGTVERSNSASWNEFTVLIFNHESWSLSRCVSRSRSHF